MQLDFGAQVRVLDTFLLIETKREAFGDGFSKERRCLSVAKVNSTLLLWYKSVKSLEIRQIGVA